MSPSPSPEAPNNNGININLALGGPATTILRGDGNGGFTVGETYAIAGSPIQETGNNGKTNLIFFTATGVTKIPGNGDGTFQALPNLPVGPTGLTGQSNGLPTGFVVADVNGDGLTDVLSISATGNLVTALGRGNGTFSITNLIPATADEFLLAGDFNAHGHTDIIAILPSPSIGNTAIDSQIFFYKGNGDGSFQPASAPVDLQARGALHAVAADFNSDGHLDVIVSLSGNALVFVPGNGDGTFGTPTLFSAQTSTSSPGSPLTADLNNDKKTDLIWNDSVYLGNGDGTFRQQPLGLIGTVLAVGDLNGDGIPDIVIQPAGVEGSAPGATVYAGNGDGTFQSTPLFTTTILANAFQTTSALIGDVNADGHPDLVFQTQTSNLTAVVSVYLGDGKGNFIVDPNTYAAGNTIEGAMSSPMATFARLNNQAPALPNDNALDYLTFTSFGATSLVNQTNPTPTAPSLIPSTITLAVSSGGAMPNQHLTFTATVTGAHPTGTVTFVNGTTPIGTATIANGTATLTASFAAINTYSVIANYAGDSINLPSTSNAVSIVVSIPDFTFSNRAASPITIPAGQTITTTLTVAPLGGYSGTVKFSCTALPFGTICSFSSPTVTVANGLNETTTLTISTTAPFTAAASVPPRKLPGSAPAIAWASLFLCLASLPQRMRRLNQQANRSVLLILMLITGFLSLAGCTSSPAKPNPPTPISTPGTPSGPQSVTVTAADTAGGPSHSANLQFTIQ